MATLESIAGIVGIIKAKIMQERKTYAAVSEELKQTYPTVTRGFSARSIRRFCKVHDIHVSSRLSDMELDRVVSSSVAKVIRNCLYVILVIVLYHARAGEEGEGAYVVRHIESNSYSVKTAT